MGKERYKKVLEKMGKERYKKVFTVSALIRSPCMYVCMHVCMHVCMYTCIYMHVCMCIMYVPTCVVLSSRN